MQGTNWVAPNEGSTLREIYRAFGPFPVYIRQVGFRLIPTVHSVYLDWKTNLHLTGEPINGYDRMRIQADAFEVGDVMP
jgi:hypothetical protein